MNKNHQVALFGGAIIAACLCNPFWGYALNNYETNGLFHKKKKQTEKSVSEYEKITGKDSVNLKGVLNIIHKGDNFYFELPAKLMGRVFLVSNKLQQVPLELNEAGVQ